MSLFIRVDVTAVKLIKHFIISGIGSSIYIYDKYSQKFITKVKVLNGQKVYGIIPSKCQVLILIFGGKEFNVISILNNNGKIDFQSSEPILCDDWLHSGIWLNQTEVVLLSAHNVVEIWNIANRKLKTSYVGKDNSILYSGLLVPLRDDTIAFCGTVYSEVIVQSCSDGPLDRLKGHKGVIFSISCNPAKGIIVTTSDDRSVRIWGITTSSSTSCEYKDYWKNITVKCLFELYGHTARVMRNCVTDDCIVSVGEDAGICFWDFKGKLLRKLVSHQNACIWSVDADDTHLVTGGGDCGVKLHPLCLKSVYDARETINFELGTPKIIEFTARRNIIIVNENNIVYYDLILQSYLMHKLNHDSTYKMLGVSSCKQLVAIADMNGKLDIFVENCKGGANIQNIIDTKLNIGRLLSMHWADNRHLVFCSDGGLLTVLAPKGLETEVFAQFLLPNCKERWLTSAALHSNTVLIVGDRCGHIHIYCKGSNNPIKSFYKVHGRYGATSITCKEKEFVTTGRNGTIKYFTLSDNASEIKYMTVKNVEFQWVEKFINKFYVCGFDERTFVVYDIDSNSKLIEVNCGGGHRSYDVVRYIDKVGDNYKEFVKFIYVKNSSIHLHTFQMDQIVSINIINGTHAKEINCMKAVTCYAKNDINFFIAGGEDTTLRISRLEKGKFKDDLTFKHLSSVRSIRTLSMGNNKMILASAGGRAQICVRVLEFKNANSNYEISSEELVDYLIKGTDKERKRDQSWRSCTVDFDPDTRIMDLEIVKIGNGIFVIAACSDAILRTFNLAEKLMPLQDVKYHKTCVLKTHLINYKGRYLLTTCTTRGEVTVWDLSDMEDIKVVGTLITNKSGVNAITSKVIGNKVLIATGGDDNAIHLNLLDVHVSIDDVTMAINDTWCSDKYHSSQITGLLLREDTMVSASIDQRLTVFKVNAENMIECAFVSQVFSDVADIQGMEILESSEKSLTVSVYGKGIEVIKIPMSKC